MLSKPKIKITFAPIRSQRLTTQKLKLFDIPKHDMITVTKDFAELRTIEINTGVIP